MREPEKGRKVLLLGTHGQFNIGDELLLETFLTHLGSQHRYRVNSYAPDDTAAQLSGRFRVQVFDTAGDRRQFLRFLRRSDVVIFGGGSIIKELNSTTGRRRYSTLLMVLATVTFARFVARRPVLMSNIGVGPVSTKRGRWLARAILRQASLVSVRDRGSYLACQDLGLSPESVRLLPDAVFVNEPTMFLAPDQEFAPADPDRSGDHASPLRIALSLNHDLDNPANWDTFLAQLAVALRSIAQRTPIEVIALPMQSRFKEDNDLEILRSFLASLPEIPSVLAEPQDHRDVAAIIAGSDVLLGERLHAIVIASIVGRPVVAVMYNVKVRELVDQLALEESSIDPNHLFSTGALTEAVLAAARADNNAGERLALIAAGFRQELESYFADVRAWVEDPRTRNWARLKQPVRVDHR